MKDRNTEIREAIDAGNRALDALDEALGHLKTARGLGVWDMLGGGFLSSLLKHSKWTRPRRLCSRRSRSCAISAGSWRMCR